MLFIEVPANTSSVPPLLKIAPPPSSAPAPLAMLPFRFVVPTVIVPVLFHKPPPSKAALLLDTILFVNVSPEVPERCIAPPLPGFAIVPNPISTPAELPLKVIPFKVMLVFEFCSIAPPALLA